MSVSPAFFSLPPNLKLFLASASPRRRELLASLGIPFEILFSSQNEPKPFAHEAAHDFALRAAQAKVKAALMDLGKAITQDFLILAADTLVCLDGEILGKPQSQEHAFQILKKLAGKKHQVITGCQLLWQENFNIREEAFFVSSDVFFYSWPDSILKSYASSEEVADKAGAYAIQGKGAFLIRSIQGSWTNIVGLPLAELLEKMHHLGLLRLI